MSGGNPDEGAGLGGRISFIQLVDLAVVDDVAVHAILKQGPELPRTTLVLCNNIRLQSCRLLRPRGTAQAQITPAGPVIVAEWCDARFVVVNALIIRTGTRTEADESAAGTGRLFREVFNGRCGY